MTRKEKNEGLGLLNRAIARAKQSGYTEGWVAENVLHISPTTLWRVKIGKRPLKPRELQDLRKMLAAANGELVAEVEG